ncbi:gp15 [Burkholderia phage BcepMu]|uniref:Gp15 n=2 Tax=root TaxID=1 RepID=Q6QID4_BPBMU|nr:gp15 [Burkholderia phage BcepMu]AAS47855.1 gp15 [Burkholderia phage BcepMu]CAR57470.1 hypothetical phage protein [Burkholderia cenocepacia J2315]
MCPRPGARNRRQAGAQGWRNLRRPGKSARIASTPRRSVKDLMRCNCFGHHVDSPVIGETSLRQASAPSAGQLRRPVPVSDRAVGDEQRRNDAAPAKSVRRRRSPVPPGGR